MLRLGLLPGVEDRGRFTNLVVLYSARRCGSVRQQALEKRPAPVAESCPPDSLSLECVARLLIPVSAFPWMAVKDADFGVTSSKKLTSADARKGDR
jgi:hypothetical protein